MLAIGFSAEHEGFCASRYVEKENAQNVAEYLNKEFGVWFEQILLVKNDDPCPTVVHHYNIDKDYQEV
jgi:hypothetical protein